MVPGPCRTVARSYRARGIRRVFGDIRVPVTALAWRFGVSSVTAPAAICAIVLGMVDGFVPSGVAYEQPDPECAIEVAHGPARLGAIRTAIVNASSLGGGNYSIVIRRWEDYAMSES